MGNKITFPIVNQPPCYVKAEDYTSSGKLFAVKKELHLNPFEEITERFMESFVQARCEVMEAKAKFLHIDYDNLTEQYPTWSVDDILDLKAQFQSMDLNQDGLIDFFELNKCMDEMGDTSTMAERKKHFKELDEDGSGAVDFEEYIGLLTHIRKQPSKPTFQQFYQVGEQNAQLRKLSIVQRIQHGLF